jgi:long-chain acyl-CoA synthetase
MLLLGETLQQALRRYPRAVATLCGSTRHTYEEFYERVCRLANGLAGLGLEKGDRIAVLMLNCHRFLEIYYACALGGYVIVPLNVRWGAKEFAYALQDCHPKVFMLDAVVAQHLGPFLEPIRSFGVQHFLFASEERPPAGMIAYEELLRRSTSAPPSVELSEDDLAGLFYTSGTTGEPKGVMLTHKNLILNAYHAQIAIRFDAESVYLHAAPMFHLADGAATYTVTWNGGTHAFVPKFDPADLLKAISRHRVTSTVLVPTMINMLINHPDMEKSDLSSLQQIMYGASPIPPELLKRAMQTLKCRFQQGYGMTEAAPLVSVLTAQDHERALRQDEKLLASAGRPIFGVDVRIVNDEDRDLSIGEVGEIVVRGPNLMKGYWQKPEETERALRGGWYHTKDMARQDSEGYLYIVDRKDDMIITGGENVYSTEVEAVLYQRSEILEAVVIGVPDERWGEAIKALVVPRSGVHLSEAEVIAHCKAVLSPYKVPRSVEFVAELPKSGTGKILKSALRERYWMGKERRV